MPESPDKPKVVRLIKKSQLPSLADESPPVKESSPSQPSEPSQLSSSAEPPQWKSERGPIRFNRPRRPGPPGKGRVSPWSKKPSGKKTKAHAGAASSKVRTQARASAPRAAKPAKPAPVVLTPAQQEEILNLYREMVGKGERPPEGRRVKIATLLNIPYAAVAQVVREHVTHERYRRTNFEIEKLYWQQVRLGQKNAGTIAQQIATQLNLDLGRVWWWLEKLHEPRKSFVHDPELGEAEKNGILAAYEAYLQQAEPPEKGLHQTLAEQIGNVTPRQVHKVLWAYRDQVWQTLEGREPPVPVPPANDEVVAPS
ncbi:MAG: hypothetical protein RMM98_12515 [Acidobacteriota bacterium]|nr:hypothetical protein [Blastocatellia bacterium]MDW8240432.1 hypothetical protein [Acidobacteriota bacterium]